jgi:hypothetical protein
VTPRFRYLALVLAALAVAGCKPRRSSGSSPGSSADPSSPGATSGPASGGAETKIVMPDGLIAMHFPSDWEQTEHSTGAEGSSVVIGGKTKETHGTVAWVSKPKMANLDALVKQFHTPGADESNEVRKNGTCAGKPGIEIRSSWTVKNFPFVKRRCFTVVNGHGFIMTYTILERLSSTMEPKLKAIVDATEFLK